MTENFYKPIPKDKRKKILLLSDDLRLYSGVAVMSREIVVRTAHHFNWFQLGATSSQSPEIKKIFDVSKNIEEQWGVEDPDVKIMPYGGYGDPIILRSLIQREKPDAIFIFTDPRYWEWLFELEREIRTKIPIFYLNIWDNLPYPQYNKLFYESVDVLMAISKQTENINRVVLGEKAKTKLIEYVPHGIDPEGFFPVRMDEEMSKSLPGIKKKMFGGKDIEFLVFYNSKNLLRKKPADLIVGFQQFCDMLTPEEASKCALILHTDPVDNYGTDLRAVRRDLTQPETNIFFSTEKIETPQMNVLYNLADLTVLPSFNEGWGLAVTESLMAGTMVAGTVTGGIQDQMRFEDEKGEWINFTEEFPSNHRGKYTKCGEWALPIFPSNISLSGAVPTPYIYYDNVSPEDIAKVIKEAYDLPKEERLRRGLKGREWVMSEESGMSVPAMANKVIDVIDKGFETFVPREKYDLVKVEL